MFCIVLIVLTDSHCHCSKWNFSFSSRAETVRSALDVLAICCVIPSVPVVFCDRMELPDEPSAAGINFILGASEGEIVADAEVQKSALAVLVHCVCAPINKVSVNLNICIIRMYKNEKNIDIF